MSDDPRLVIGHDDELVREVLAVACARGGVDLVASARTFDELLAHCADLTPDVVLIADRLDGRWVEDVLPAVQATGAQVVVLSDDRSPDRAGQLLSRDVAGYLSYDARPDEVVGGIVAVARGDVALNPAVLSIILDQWRTMRSQPAQLPPHRRPALTDREQDILAAMADGLPAKAIATRLGLAVKTVENHKIRVFDKLGVRSQAHAVAVAMAQGLTSGRRPASLDVVELR